MNWLLLDSRMLAAVAYEEQKQILYLRFRKTGDVYRYFGSSRLPFCGISGIPRCRVQEAASSSLTSVTTSPFERMAKLYAA